MRRPAILRDAAAKLQAAVKRKQITPALRAQILDLMTCAWEQDSTMGVGLTMYLQAFTDSLWCKAKDGTKKGEETKCRAEQMAMGAKYFLELLGARRIEVDREGQVIDIAEWRKAGA